MKLLVAFRHRKAVEPFVEVAETLAARGHDLVVGVHERDDKVRSLFTRSDLTFVTLPDGRRDAWSEPSELGRHLRDVVQYLGTPYRGAAKLRRRVVERLLKSLGVPVQVFAAWSSDAMLDLGPEAARRLQSALDQLESLTPPDPLTVQVLQQLRPDAIVATPLVHFGSTQVELVKAAQALKIPIGMLLFSWDNLSTKGALHAAPDHLFVWNDRQRREATELHGFATERVSVTGAPRFDRFFRRRSQVTAEDFRASLGVPPATPALLYLCSSRLVAEKEINFIRRWVRAVRTSPNETLRQALLIVRPHPDLPLSEGKWMADERTFRWPGFAAEPRARILFDDPRAVVLTSDYDAPDMLFECIYQSAAVVGLNTSAEIEAGIVGRPVFTILSDLETADGQHTTLHFHYLTEAEGGFVHVAASLDEHVAALAAAVEAPPSSARVQQRVADFVRPAGWDIPASTVLADAIERTMVGAPAPVAAAAPAPAPVAVVTATGSMDWIGRNLAPGAVIYDLTAGSGAFAVDAAAHYGCTVIAFESNLAALMALWQRTVDHGCEGLVVPLLLKPGARSALYQERYDRLSPEASRLAIRAPTWRGHDSSPGDEVIQPVLNVPLEWTMRRWKLPLPSAARAVLRADDREMLAALESLTAEPRLTIIVLGGDPATRAAAAARLVPLGFASAGPADDESMSLFVRPEAAAPAHATSPQARVQ